MKEPFRSVLIVVVLSLLFVGVELQLTKKSLQHKHTTEVVLEPEIVTVQPEVSHPPHQRATLDQPEVHLSEALRRKASNIAESTKEKVHDIKESVDTLEEKAHQAKDTIQEKAKHAKDVVQDTASDIKQTVKGTAHDMKEAVKDKATDIKETVEEKTQEAKDKLKNTAKAVQHKLHNTRVHWTETVGEWKDGVTQRFHDLWNGLKNVFVRKPIQKLHHAKHAAEKDIHKAQDKLDSLRHNVDDRIKHVRDSALHKFQELEGDRIPTHHHTLHEVVTDANGDIVEDYTVSYEYHYKRTVKPSKNIVQSYLTHT